MRQFLLGLLTIILLIIVGYAGFRATTTLLPRLVRSPSPSPTPAGFDVSSAIPSVSPFTSASPEPSVVPTTKGGLPLASATPRPSQSGTVQGTSTRTTTTTTTRVFLTLIKSSDCRTFVTEVKDITGPLTVRYNLKDNYSANVKMWKQNGEELLSQREIKGSGELIKVEGLSYFKLQAQPAKCDSTSDTWLTITAER